MCVIFSSLFFVLHSRLSIRFALICPWIAYLLSLNRRSSHRFAHVLYNIIYVWNIYAWHRAQQYIAPFSPFSKQLCNRFGVLGPVGWCQGAKPNGRPLICFIPFPFRYQFDDNIKFLSRLFLFISIRNWWRIRFVLLIKNENALQVDVIWNYFGCSGSGGGFVRK